MDLQLFGPFVRDCKTERLFLCYVVRSMFDPFEVCPSVGTVVTAVVACGVPEWLHSFGYGWYLYPVWVVWCDLPLVVFSPFSAREALKGVFFLTLKRGGRSLPEHLWIPRVILLLDVDPHKVSLPFLVVHLVAVQEVIPEDAVISLPMRSTDSSQSFEDFPEDMQRGTTVTATFHVDSVNLEPLDPNQSNIYKSDHNQKVGFSSVVSEASSLIQVLHGDRAGANKAKSTPAALVVAFLLPLFGLTSACTPRVARGARLSDVRSGKATASHVTFRAGEALLGQGELLRGSSERFEVVEVRGACSRREDVVWSGGNAEGSPVFAFFAK
ncbi:hypothetical protein Taro_043545, partial [Colocasia esculenta]|nr:hypothetical protein [Colocasia esculenta]